MSASEQRKRPSQSVSWVNAYHHTIVTDGALGAVEAGKTHRADTTIEQVSGKRLNGYVASGMTRQLNGSTEIRRDVDSYIKLESRCFAGTTTRQSQRPPGHRCVETDHRAIPVQTDLQTALREEHLCSHSHW